MDSLVVEFTMCADGALILDVSLLDVDDCSMTSASYSIFHHFFGLDLA